MLIVLFICALIIFGIVVYQISNKQVQSKGDYRIKNQSTELTEMKVGVNKFASTDTVFKELEEAFQGELKGNPEGRIR